MKAAKFKELSKEELDQKCADMEKEQRALNIRKSAGQIEQPSRIRSLRRDIARAKTVMAERRNQ
jgi:large subunit ribosomal protein L29